MKKRLLVLVALLATACSREPPNPAVALDVKAFDAELVKLQQFVRTSSQRLEKGEDFRGRDAQADVRQWVLPKATLDEIAELREQALESRYPNDARQLLQKASHRIDEDVQRLNAIGNYWNDNLPAPFWRRYWDALYASNDVQADTPDSALVAIEARMKTALDGGDFSAAAKAAQQLDDVLPESLNQASGRIFKNLKKDLVYLPRRTPCPERAAAAGAKPKLVRAEMLEPYYPPEAVKRGEQGAVVLRASLDREGCARQVAIAVHSGVPALDDAALRWFESARFSPAAEKGMPIDSTLAFKVKFVLAEGAAPGAAAGK